MSRHVFEWGRDEEFGNDGWKLRGMPHFNAADAYNIAHDTMEHLPGGIRHGAVADELMALGARLYLRVGSGWWARQYYGDPVAAWTFEVIRQLEYIKNGSAAPPAIVEPPCDDAALEDIIADAVPGGARRHNKDQKLYHGGYDQDYEPVDPQGPLVQAFGAWLRRGVRAGQARWRAGGSDYVMLLADNLTQEVTQMGQPEAGDLLVVRINEAAVEVSAKLVRYGETLPRD